MMERPEIVLEEQIDVGVGQFTFRVRLMSDGALGIDYSDESLTVSGELNPESMRKFALAAARLQLHRLAQAGHSLPVAKDAVLRVPVAEFDRALRERIEASVDRPVEQATSQWANRAGPVPEELEEDPDALVSPMFQGVHVDRLATSLGELAAAQLWEAENLQASSLKRSSSMVSTWEPAKSLLGQLLSRDPDRGIRPSPRDWMVASTVMQWLGTARGWIFFSQLQMAAARTESEEE